MKRKGMSSSPSSHCASFYETHVLPTTSCKELRYRVHENPINGLVADTGSRADGRADVVSVWGFFLLRKERLETTTWRSISHTKLCTDGIKTLWCKQGRKERARDVKKALWRRQLAVSERFHPSSPPQSPVSWIYSLFLILAWIY